MPFRIIDMITITLCAYPFNLFSIRMLIRFDDRIRYRPREEKDYTIKKHTNQFPLYVTALLTRLGSSLLSFVSKHVPEDWLALTHPEGALFFRHKVKVRLCFPL